MKILPEQDAKISEYFILFSAQTFLNSFVHFRYVSIYVSRKRHYLFILFQSIYFILLRKHMIVLMDTDDPVALNVNSLVSMEALWS